MYKHAATQTCMIEDQEDPVLAVAFDVKRDLLHIKRDLLYIKTNP